MKHLFRLVLILLMASSLYASTTTAAYQKALDEYQDNLFDASLGDLNTVLTNDPSNWKALELMAYCFYKQGNVVESLQTARESLKAHPSNPPLTAFVDRQEHGGIATEKPQATDKTQGKEWENMPSPPDTDVKTVDAQKIATDSSQATKAAPGLSADMRKPTFWVGPLVSIPMSANIANQFLAGPGVEANMMFASTAHEMIGLDMGLQSCPLNTLYVSNLVEKLNGSPIPSTVTISGDFTYIPILFAAKYYPGKLNEGFYLVSGVGLGINSLHVVVSGTNTVTISAGETDLLCAMGAGFDFQLPGGTEGFIQARLDLDFTSSTTDVVTLTGPGVIGTATGSLTGDNPTLFLPLQIGVRL